MPQITLPPALTPVLATATAHPELTASRRFVAAIRAGRRFNQRVPLALRRWCCRLCVPCDGQLLLEVTLTGFHSWRRGTRLLQAIAAIILAAARVWLKFDPALIYADDRDLVTFEGGPLRPMVEPVRIGTRANGRGPLPPGLSAPPAPEAPAAPDVPPRPQGPRGTIITRSGYFL
jgi:hypothetical protein